MRGRLISGLADPSRHEVMSGSFDTRIIRLDRIAAARFAKQTLKQQFSYNLSLWHIFIIPYPPFSIKTNVADLRMASCWIQLIDFTDCDVRTGPKIIAQI